MPVVQATQVACRGATPTSKTTEEDAIVLAAERDDRDRCRECGTKLPPPEYESSGAKQGHGKQLGIRRTTTMGRKRI